MKSHEWSMERIAGIYCITCLFETGPMGMNMHDRRKANNAQSIRRVHATSQLY
jgi:hypothetical protein